MINEKTLLKLSAISVLLIFLLGCEPPSASQIAYINKQTAATVDKRFTKQYGSLWPRMQDNFLIAYSPKHQRVQKHIRYYTKHKHQLRELSRRSEPYLFYIVSAIEQRQLPSELALLPMIESAYKPFALSNVGAAGLWQIGRVTGQRYGLHQNHWYDGRRDVQAATQAALDYLQFLYKEFNQDWLLALAAYNSGEGRVKRAILKNARLGKPTDYWSLPLPTETKHFVPKFLAIVHLIKHHRQLDIKLIPIANKPYFSTIKIDSQLQLQTAAQLAGMNLNELKRLNPAYTKYVIHPEGSHELLLPTSQVILFKNNLRKRKPRPLINFAKLTTVSYKVRRGDNLSLIAKRHSTSVRAIKEANQLKSDIIISGKVLLIPVAFPLTKTT